MATTPKTVKTYALDGTKKDFTIPFEYLARKFVVVTLIGVTRKELILITDYRFTTSTQITTNKAWGPADGYELIEIRRLTSATERLVDFADGSILRAYDLNISQVQSLHIAEEARDLTADTIGVNNDGNLDARARRIVNLADGVDPGDAVSYRQMLSWSGSALNSANAAAASASSAASSATSATSSKNAAATSATNAAASQSAAATSATNAAASNTSAQNWASKAEDSIVSGGLYSSYHYSRKSAASAAAALASQNAAKTSEDNAQAWAAGVNMPSASGKQGQILRQKADGTGLEYTPHFSYWGLGTPQVQQFSGVDFNAVLDSGMYTYTSPLNAPTGTSVTHNALILANQSGGGRTLEIAQTVNTLDLFFRAQNSGAWLPWQKILHTGNVPDGIPPTGYSALPNIGSSLNVDFNTLVSPGWYKNLLGNGSPNAPAPVGFTGVTNYWYLQVMVYPGGNCTQVAYPYGTVSSTTPICWRSRYQGVWQPWQYPPAPSARLVASTSSWTSFAPAGTTPSGANRLTHNLGINPIGYQLQYRCITAEYGYAVGDIITPADTNYQASTVTMRGGSLVHVDNNNVDYYNGGTGVVIIDKTNGVAVSMTMARWQIRVTAWGTTVA